MPISKKQVIIILGPPGSGKGTQGSLLAEKLSLFYFETAKIGEERINQAKKGDFISVAKKKYFFEEEKKAWQTGKLWDPPFATFLVQEKIKELAKEGKGIVIAGTPRTMYEGKKIIPLLKKLYEMKNISVILLEQSEKASIWRNSNRRICELMRHPMIYFKENEKLTKCPLDGSLLEKRKGLDDPETIRIRLREYKKKTYPLVGYFKNVGLEVKKINGEQSVSDVFNDILKAIK